jgi:hypothetical protein
LPPIVEEEHRAQDPIATGPQILTPIRFQSLIPSGVGAASTAEASSSSSTTLIRPSGVGWTIGGHLARFDGDLLGNPFQALVNLIPHESLSMKRNVSTRGMAKQMVFF